MGLARATLSFAFGSFNGLTFAFRLEQRIDVRHADHGTLVVEPKSFVFRALCQPFVKLLHACTYRPRWRMLAFARV